MFYVRQGSQNNNINITYVLEYVPDNYTWCLAQPPEKSFCYYSVLKKHALQILQAD